MRINEPKFTEFYDLMASDHMRAEPEPRELIDDSLVIPTVYFLTDAEGAIQYIGQTKQLGIRLAQHKVNVRLNRLIDWKRTYYVAPGVEAESQRLRWEGIFILLAHPPGNKVVLLQKNNNLKWTAVRWKTGRKPFRKLRYTGRTGRKLR